jgi:hypothetical protein
MPPPLSTFFDGVDGDDARLNLTPCATVEADMCIARAQWRMCCGDRVFINLLVPQSCCIWAFLSAALTVMMVGSN